MSNGSSEYKCKALKRRRASLIEEHDAVSRQLESALEAGQRVRLERQLKGLDNEIAEVNAQLSDLGCTDESMVNAVSDNKHPESPRTNNTSSAPELSDNEGGQSSTWQQTLDAIRKYLWLEYVLWLALSALGFIANLGQVFGLSPCSQFKLLTLLTLLGGVMPLIFSMLLPNKAKYQVWDRWLTAFLTLAASAGLVIFVYQQC
jgi:hypothetical protein